MILKKLLWYAEDDRPVALSYNSLRKRLTVVCTAQQQDPVQDILMHCWHIGGGDWLATDRRLRLVVPISFEAFTHGCKEATAAGLGMRGVKSFERLTR